MHGKLAFVGLFFILGGASYAQAKTRARMAANLSAAEEAYQGGLNQYAQGRLPEALAFFEDAIRRDSMNRAARLAVARVRAEMALTGARSAEAAPAQLSRRPPLEPDGSASFLSDVARFVFFERTAGDERDREGWLRAIQGRIAQLLIERKVARARGWTFPKEAELHALSRRLP